MSLLCVLFSFGLVKLPYKIFLFSCLVALLSYLLKTNKMYGTYRNLCYLFVGICFMSCSPQHRLSRLLKNNPNLYEIFRHDSILVRNEILSDSVFFFKSEKDTIVFNNATIFRHFDTIRLRQSCPPCTTYLSKTILQPTEKIIKEKGYKRSLREKLEDSIFPLLIGLLLGLIITRR